MGQGNEQKSLSASLAAAQATLPKLLTQKDNLETQVTQARARLAQARSLLTESEADFATSVESIEVGEQLFKVADSKGVEVTDLGSAKPSVRKIAGITYTTTSFSVTARGAAIPAPGFTTRAEYQAYLERTSADLVGYVVAVATNQSFASYTVEEVNVTVPKLVDDAEVLSQGVDLERATATINLVLYAYKEGA